MPEPAFCTSCYSQNSCQVISKFFNGSKRFIRKYVYFQQNWWTVTLTLKQSGLNSHSACRYSQHSFQVLSTSFKRFERYRVSRHHFVIDKWSSFQQLKGNNSLVTLTILRKFYVQHGSMFIQINLINLYSFYCTLWG